MDGLPVELQALWLPYVSEKTHELLEVCAASPLFAAGAACCEQFWAKNRVLVAARLRWKFSHRKAVVNVIKERLKIDPLLRFSIAFETGAFPSDVIAKLDGLQSLDLQHGTLLDAELGTIIALKESLTELRLSHVSGLTPHCASTLVALTKLHLLDLWHTADVVSPAFVQRICDLQQIRVLNFGTFGVTPTPNVGNVLWMRKMPFLEHLDVSGLSGVTDDALAELLPALPSLRTLRIARCPDVGANEFYWTSAVQSELAVLDIGQNPAVRDAHVRNIAMNLRSSVRELFLFGCASLTADVMGYLTSMERLEYLQLQLTNADDAWMKLLTEGPHDCKCTRLVLSDTSVSDQGVEFLSRAASGFEELNLSGLTFATGSGFNAFAVAGTSLTSLILERARLTDAAVELVLKIRTLRRLTLAQCFTVTDAVFSNVGAVDPDSEIEPFVSQVERLNISGCRGLGDKVLSDISEVVERVSPRGNAANSRRFPRLTHLDISNLPVSATGIASLSSLSRSGLQVLHAEFSKGPLNAAVRDLAAKLRFCKVI